MAGLPVACPRLLAETDMTFESHAVRGAVRAAYFPLVELREPKLSLDETDADKLRRRMRDIMDCQSRQHAFRSDMLQLLYSAFLLDLLDIQERSVGRHRLSERTSELFVGFLRLLPRHFADRHDIAFYADHLHITPIYLSRIVKQTTGRTVGDFVDRMLLMEAAWLLQTTTMTVSQIADRLHFASHSSFIRFFVRMKGISPKTYRTTL